MNEDGYIFKQFKKAPLPSVPDKFFHHFSEELWQLIELEDNTEGLLDGLVLNRFKNALKTNKPIDLHIDKVASINRVEKPKVWSKTKQMILWTGAIAASLAIFFTWPASTDSGIELATDETTQEVLLAYLDEDDLVEYLVDANTTQDEETTIEEEVLYEELEDEIYNYINDI